MMERMPSGGRPSNLRIHAVAYVSPDNITNGIDSPHINEFDTLERLKSTSLSSDLLLISQLSCKYRPHMTVAVLIITFKLAANLVVLLPKISYVSSKNSTSSSISQRGL